MTVSEPNVDIWSPIKVIPAGHRGKAPTIKHERVNSDSRNSVREAQHRSEEDETDGCDPAHGRLALTHLLIIRYRLEDKRRWTIVSHAGNSALIPTRWSMGYAVCPSCRRRQLLLGRPLRMRCEGCYEEFEIDRDELYLKTG